eukprot:gene20243-biopygen19100
MYAPQRPGLNVHYRPLFDGVGGFFAGSAERGRCRRPDAGPGEESCRRARRWAGGAQGGGGGGGPFFPNNRRGTLISPAFREFAPRCEPPPARAKCGAMIRMSSGTRSAGVQYHNLPLAGCVVVRKCDNPGETAKVLGFQGYFRDSRTGNADHGSWVHGCPANLGWGEPPPTLPPPHLKSIPDGERHDDDHDLLQGSSKL